MGGESGYENSSSPWSFEFSFHLNSRFWKAALAKVVRC
jgi:hypothetical protein